MIERGDTIVTVNYQQRNIVGPETTQTYALVGTPENVAAQVARQVQGWLERGGSGPLTLHTAGHFNVVDANDAAQRRREEEA